ncbi:MAG: GNAT family N-acetyltransferase, partial [Thermoplasmata archaeon]
MRIVELSDLPDDLGAQIGALNWLDGDPPVDATYMRRRLRQLGYPVSKYQAVLAVDRGQVLGKVETVLQPYATPVGTESAVWVTGVVTRPDAVRLGVARALLQATHALERTAGRRWAFLWTHRSWAAHGLYEELGYRDVYAPPSALRRLPRSTGKALPRGYGWRTIRRTEASLLERLLEEASRGRQGFIPRYPGSFRARFKLGWRRPSEFSVLTMDSTPVGYAHAPLGRHARTAYEVVVTHSRHATAMLDALERGSAGRWLAMARTTFITDHEALFRQRGYAVYRHSHATMMAKPLLPGSRRPR